MWVFLQWGMNRNDHTDHSVVAAPMHEHPLARLIAHEIESNGGWIGFERFMELALYAPGLGYYSGGRRVLGHGPEDGSDFVTAPELSPQFGQSLACQVTQALKATATREIWEFGAGSGALAAQLLAALGSGLERYTIVDLSGTLRDWQHRTLQKLVPEHAHKVVWADALPDQLQGVIVGNEVLDAMPVQLLTWDGDAWLERGVALDRSSSTPAPSFVWQDRPCDPAQRPPTDHPDEAFAPGTVVESHRQAEGFITSLADRLVAGAAFFIDYGFPEAEFYLPQRVGGTLMCHQAHRSDPDPLSDVGAKDITAHVNFTGVALAGQNAGWEVLGYTSQARFLMNCGLLPLLMPVDAAHPTVDEIKARAAGQKLIAEHEMGELFKVIGFVKGEWFDALGFSQGDRTHML
jgi:SAM-dependent MidA family methyltransferase